MNLIVWRLAFGVGVSAMSHYRSPNLGDAPALAAFRAFRAGFTDVVHFCWEKRLDSFRRGLVTGCFVVKKHG